MACSAGGSVAALAALMLAAVVLTESAPVAAEPMDFRIVSRPKHWGGLELPGKPASTQQRRLHGAVKPHLHKLQGAPQGYESYRVYFIKDYAKVQNAYALFGDDYAPMSLKTDDGSPLFQVPIPFGADYGGVNKGLFSVKPSSEYDTWVTIGADAGNAQNAISAVGLGSFDESLYCPDGAVFAMNPDIIPTDQGSMPPELAEQGALLVAQVTVPEGVTFTGHFNAQGRSAGESKSDWQEYGICFSTGAGCRTHGTTEL